MTLELQELPTASELVGLRHPNGSRALGNFYLSRNSDEQMLVSQRFGCRSRCR